MDTQNRRAATVELSQLIEQRKVAYSISEAAEVCSLSRAFIYKEWQAGRGPMKVKIGKRTLITDESLRSWLRSLEYRSSP